MTAITDADLERLSKLVVARRLELAMPITHAAATAVMSKDTWKRVEVGMPIRTAKYSDVDRTLQWAPGSSVAILEGGEPTPAEGAGEAKTVITRLDPEDFDQAFVSAMVATKGDMTAAEIREIGDRVLAELKRRGIL